MRSSPQFSAWRAELVEHARAAVSLGLVLTTGMLQKQKRGGSGDGWQRRWFMLRGSELLYFDSEHAALEAGDLGAMAPGAAAAANVSRRRSSLAPGRRQSTVVCADGTVQKVDRLIPLTGETRLLRELPTAAAAGGSGQGGVVAAEDSGGEATGAGGDQAGASAAGEAAPSNVPVPLPPATPNCADNLVRIIVHEFKSRSAQGVAAGRLLGEHEEERLHHIAEVLRHCETFVAAGQSPGPTPLRLTCSQRKDKHHVFAAHASSTLDDSAASARGGAPGPPTWHNVFKFNSQAVDVPVPRAKHGTGPNLHHPLVLTLKGPKGDLAAAHAKGKAQKNMGKLADKLAVAKVALSDLHLLQQQKNEQHGGTPGTLSAPVHGWFKLYSPKTDRPVGQLRLTLQLMTVADAAAADATAAAAKRPGAPSPEWPNATQTGKAAVPQVQAEAVAAEAPPASLTRFQIVTPERTWVLAAARSVDADRWLEHFRAVVAVLRQG